jgi:hypothetical protein
MNLAEVNLLMRLYSPWLKVESFSVNEQHILLSSAAGTICLLHRKLEYRINQILLLSINTKSLNDPEKGFFPPSLKLYGTP